MKLQTTDELISRFRQLGTHRPLAFKPILPGAFEVNVSATVALYVTTVVAPMGIESPIVGVALLTVRVAAAEVVNDVFPLNVLVTITRYRYPFIEILVEAVVYELVVPPVPFVTLLQVLPESAETCHW